MGWLKNLYEKEAEIWTYATLTDGQVPGDVKSGEIIAPEGAYLSVMLKSMRIPFVRRLTTTFYGVVHSFIKLPPLSSDAAAFQVVTTPGELRNVDPKKLDRVIQLNRPLLDKLPYRGGALEIELGLFSVGHVVASGLFIEDEADIPLG